MNILNIPNKTFVWSMRENVSYAMNKWFCIDEWSGLYGQKVCAICDCFITVDNPPKLMLVSHLASYCQRSGANIDHWTTIFPKNLVNEYRNNYSVLCKYAVSIHFLLVKAPVALFLEIEEPFVHVCWLCHNTWKKDVFKHNGIWPSQKLHVLFEPFGMEILFGKRPHVFRSYQWQNWQFYRQIKEQPMELFSMLINITGYTDGMLRTKIMFWLT